MGDKRKMKLSGDLDYRIRYDVEHDLFHAQNIFNDEYIPPTFIEYVQRLEKEVVDLQGDREIFLSDFYCDRKGGCKVTELEKENAELKDDNKVMADNYSKMEQKFYDNLTKAKEIIRQLLLLPYANNEEVYADVTSTLNKAEQFLNSEGK